MNYDERDILQKLTKVSAPAPGRGAHYQKLRNALVTSDHWDTTNSRGIRQRIAKKRQFLILSAGSLAVVAVMIIGIVFAPSRGASAQEIARRSYMAVSKLTIDEKRDLVGKTAIDPQVKLAEANAAKDLKVLSYDQLLAAYPHLHLVPPTTDTSKVTALRSAQFLSYTDPVGQKVVVAITQSHLPVLYLVLPPHGSNDFKAYWFGWPR